jgi:hypothetical protein
VRGLVLATITDNSPHGYNLTFAFPMILFIVIAGTLYLIYSRPHKVPGHGPLRVSAAARHAESVHEAAGAHAASTSTTSGSVSEDNTEAAAADPASDQPSAPSDSAAAAPPDKDEGTE